MARLTCVRECVLHAFVPAFDRDGREISMIVSQLASDQLQVFRRVAGADVALMESGDTSRDESLPQLWGGICACSPMRPTLVPVLTALNYERSAPAPDTRVAKVADERSYLVQIHTLPAPPGQ